MCISQPPDLRDQNGGVIEGLGYALVVANR
jgi:hypothetical protein